MTKFEYGTKRVKFANRNVYVDPVDNLHDLTDYEKTLDKRNVPWAVYLKIDATGRNTYSTKFVLVAEENV